MATVPDDELTQTAFSTMAPTSDSGPPDTQGLPPTPHGHRFAPGSIIAGRYRVVALLGRGGMGEVYRAEDLTLDQPVALKFLSGVVAAGDSRLAQFHNELKTARQVSHKNVCRLYDLGEADGRRFLTMEYVDGEDLSSLLRRIGRIPHDKAVDIARQLCAGVAAAHDRGVVHRDLKPSNVMIDAEGNVRITDFGIATAAGSGNERTAGTLQYMAPELFTGTPASVKSDLYALGLVLFEVFTGRRAVEARTLQELQDFHLRGTVTTPSSIVRDVDPAVERLILRCLDRDPERRPVSALVVAAGLPGADPLAEALAAGETPSPELLAAAGETEAISARGGIVLAVAAVIAVLTIQALIARSAVVGRVPFGPSPLVLEDRAERMIQALGYPATTGDSASGFMRHTEFTRWLMAKRETPDRYEPVANGRLGAIRFWYRTSPRPMLALDSLTLTAIDPPVLSTGMRTVVLDLQGRMLEFRSVPIQVEQDDDTAIPQMDWNPAFAAAGLDLATFAAVAPRWVPRDYADSRAAWEGPLPDTGVTVRVEASAFRGRLTSFQIIGPWTTPTAEIPRGRGRGDRIALLIVGGIVAAVMGVALLLALRNLRSGRADRRGAARLAVFLAAVRLAHWLLTAHHTSSPADEMGSLGNAAATTALYAAILWVNYVALEPYIRRIWPDTLLGWSRILAGHVRDSRVGHDLLIGILFGTVVTLLQIGRTMILPALGYAAPSAPYGVGLEMLTGPEQIAGEWLIQISNVLGAASGLVLVAVLLKLLIRPGWLAFALTSLAFAFLVANEVGTTNTPLIYLFPLVGGAVLTTALTRYGLLTLVVSLFVFRVLTAVPFVPDPSGWTAAPGNWTLAALAVLVALGFYAARGGQQVFGRLLPE